MSAFKALNGKVYSFNDKYDFIPSVPGSVGYCYLSADTEPDAIRQRHRAEVEDEWLRNQDDTAEQISARLYLPLWNVRRALEAIRGEAPAEEVFCQDSYRAARGAVVKAVFELLAAGGPYLVKEIVARTGHSQPAVSSVLRKHWTQLTATPSGRGQDRRVRYVYSLKPGPRPESAASGERNDRSVV